MLRQGKQFKKSFMQGPNGIRRSCNHVNMLEPNETLGEFINQSTKKIPSSFVILSYSYPSVTGGGLCLSPEMEFPASAPRSRPPPTSMERLTVSERNNHTQNGPSTTSLIDSKACSPAGTSLEPKV